MCSVAVAFITDRLRIRTDERWIKITRNEKSESRIIWSDVVQKMNRTDAKVYMKSSPYDNDLSLWQLSNRALVVTSRSLYLLDIKNYHLQYLVPLSDIEGVSLSPYSDGYFIINIKKV